MFNSGQIENLNEGYEIRIQINDLFFKKKKLN